MLTEFESRLVKPDTVNDSNGAKDAIPEGARFRCYDEYELNGMLLSQIVVNLFFTAGFREKLDTYFSHMDEFDETPGYIMLTMTLNACNTSSNLNIECSETSFEYLSLPDHPGEKIKVFATKDLCLLKNYEWGSNQNKGQTTVVAA